jgi:hypothetical protein
LTSARKSLAAFGVSLLLAVSIPAAAFAHGQTTGPGSRLSIFVIITDQKVGLAVYALSDYAGSSELYEEQLTDVARGDSALFTVINRGAKPHSFTLLGKKTPVLKPGAKAHFTLGLFRRGSFPYVATTSGSSHRLKGSLTVY